MTFARNVMMTAGTGGGPPTVTSLSTTSASASTSPSVTITGTNFIAGATVSVGGTAATSVVVNSATSITCTFPARTRGTYSVSVTTSFGTGTLSNAFTYLLPATLSSISPTSGSTGVKTFTLTGSNFSIGGGNAYFSPGGYATSVTVNSDTSMTATSPSLSAGTVTVYAINSDGWSGGINYTAYAAPTISSFSTIPYGGSSGSVTITGTNFYSGATVSVGGTAATSVVVNSTTSITCTFPAKATGTYAVTVTSLGGTSAAVNATYAAPPVVPTVSSVSPSATSTASQTYYVYGTGFNAAGTLAVLVDGAYISQTYATIVSDSQAYFTQGFAAGSHSIAVYNYSGGWSNTLSGAFTTYNAPTISSVSPSSGLAGSSITITGSNFISVSSVTIGGTAASYSVGSSTSITATVPSSLGAGAKTVSVTAVGGSASSTFTVTVPAPSISSVSDGRSGNGSLTGSTITLSGSNLSGASVTIGGTAVSASVSASSISFSCPNLSTDGTKTISVTTGGGSASSSVYFWAARAAAATTYTSGSGSYTPPQWANFMDVVVRGGGGSGGGSSVTAWGGGGSAGAASGGTINLVSAGFAARSYSVGSGGAQVGTSVAGKAGGTSSAAGYSAGGGAGGTASNNGPAGAAGSAFTAGGVTSPAPTGGGFGNSAQPGANPGSGGGGGNSALGPYNGIAGRAGAVYFRVYQ